MFCWSVTYRMVVHRVILTTSKITEAEWHSHVSRLREAIEFWWHLKSEQWLRMDTHSESHKIIHCLCTKYSWSNGNYFIWYTFGLHTWVGSQKEFSEKPSSVLWDILSFLPPKRSFHSPFKNWKEAYYWCIEKFLPRR